MGTFLRFQSPALLSVADQSLLVERVCIQDWVGNCGLPVIVYVHSCSLAPGPTQCTSGDAFASPLLYETRQRVADPLAAVSFMSCGSTSADCVYSVGIFPDCSALPNGTACPDALVRVTWAGDSTAQMLSPECTGNTRFCVLPSVDIGAAPRGGIRRYASYANGDATSTQEPINVVIGACTGLLSAYLCTSNDDSSCAAGASSPGPNNKDVAASTANCISNCGMVTLSFVPKVQSKFEKPFYWGA